jgi:hypothetical protein
MQTNQAKQAFEAEIKDLRVKVDKSERESREAKETAM